MNSTWRGWTPSNCRRAGCAAFESGAAGEAGHLFPREQLQRSQVVPADLRIERLSALRAFPGRVEGELLEYYARKFAQMLTAEELHDAIVTATERPGKFVLSSKKEVGSSTAA